MKNDVPESRFCLASILLVGIATIKVLLTDNHHSVAQANSVDGVPVAPRAVSESSIQDRSPSSSESPWKTALNWFSFIFAGLGGLRVLTLYPIMFRRGYLEAFGIFPEAFPDSVNASLPLIWISIVDTTAPLYENFPNFHLAFELFKWVLGWTVFGLAAAWSLVYLTSDERSYMPRLRSPGQHRSAMKLIAMAGVLVAPAAAAVLPILALTVFGCLIVSPGYGFKLGQENAARQQAAIANEVGDQAKSHGPKATACVKLTPLSEPAKALPLPTFTCPTIITMDERRFAVWEGGVATVLKIDDYVIQFPTPKPQQAEVHSSEKK